MTQRPHVVVLGSVWPHVKENREAANVVSYQILRHLAESERFRLTYQYVGWTVADIGQEARYEIDDLASLGVTFAPPIALVQPASIVGKLRASGPRIWTDRFAALATAAEHRQSVHATLERLAPSAVLTVWSELAQNLVSQTPFPKIAYAGNPDYKVLSAFHDLESRSKSPSFAATLKNRLIALVVRRSHLAIMRGFDRVLNVAQNDARDYQRLGIDADYIQNMWPSPVRNDWRATRDSCEETGPLRIVGNVGNLSATGNSFGFLTIARDLLPRLKARLGEGRFEIHLFGGGQPRAFITPILQDPHIRIRGFVDDLDGEILRAPIFLVANNHDRFKVGHTRFLHAWSLGACCVAFSDSREAMPELMHNENALLGNDPDEVVVEIARAAADPSLRRRIGEGGLATLQRDFAPVRVVSRLSEELEMVLSREAHVKSRFAA